MLCPIATKLYLVVSSKVKHVFKAPLKSSTVGVSLTSSSSNLVDHIVRVAVKGLHSKLHSSSVQFSQSSNRSVMVGHFIATKHTSNLSFSAVCNQSSSHRPYIPVQVFCAISGDLYLQHLWESESTCTLSLPCDGPPAAWKVNLVGNVSER